MPTGKMDLISMSVACGERQVHVTQNVKLVMQESVLINTDNCGHIQNAVGFDRILHTELSYRNKYHRLAVKNIDIECGISANTVYTVYKSSVPAFSSEIILI